MSVDLDILNKVFKAYDVRGLYGSQIDEDLAWRIGHATAQFTRGQLSGYDRGMSNSNRLIVGHDMRPHSKPLVKAMIEGITSSGIDCVDIGMCDTPLVYFAINHLGACGGIMVTASHNPAEYNGFKFSGVKARPIGQGTGLEEIKHIVSKLKRMPPGASIASSSQSVDLWDEYRKHVLRFLHTPRKIKVVADASNGMAGKMFPAVFNDTDTEIIPLNYKLGSGFVHPPNPLVEANLQQVKAAVLEHHADMGICMDGDADRCMFIDEKGETVRCDIITAMLAPSFLADAPKSTVVYDLRSSRVVAEEIHAAGGFPKRERVGHAFMKKAMADSRGIFGGELSGHFYFRENYNCDSGAIAFATAVSVVAAQDKPFSKFVEPLQRYAHSGEINFEVEDKQAKMKEIAETFSDAEIDYLDGVSCQYDKWWCNVRPSNTEPLLRLTLEANTQKLMNEKLLVVKKMLGEPVDH